MENSFITLLRYANYTEIYYFSQYSLKENKHCYSSFTHYIAIMVFWEEKKISVKELGKKLFLDSGTLTPVSKSLEAKGYISRSRSAEDERVLIAEIIEEGENLREQAKSVPENVAHCVKLEPDEAIQLYQLLYKLLE